MAILQFLGVTVYRPAEISGFRDILSEKCSGPTFRWFSMAHTE